MLFLARSKSSINIGGDDSDDNEDRITSPVYFYSVQRYLAVEEQRFNVPQCPWSCSRHTAANMQMTYANRDCGMTSWPPFRPCFSR